MNTSDPDTPMYPGFNVTFEEILGFVTEKLGNKRNDDDLC